MVLFVLKSYKIIYFYGRAPVFSDVNLLCSYVSDRLFPANASTLSDNLSNSISYQPLQKIFSVNVTYVTDQRDPATEV